MSEFFKQTPVVGGFQKRFLESIFHKKTVVGSFPVGFPFTSLYHFPALMGEGLVIAICPDAYAVRKNLAYLANYGYGYPDVAALDGSQTPHERRQTLDHINRHRVQLLYTVAEHFSSLQFIDLMVHAQVRFLVIEQAHLMLEGFAASHRYRKLWEGMEVLRKKPPVVLLTYPLQGPRLKELADRLSMGEFEFFEEKPEIAQTQVSVEMRVTERGKFGKLARVLSDNPEPGKYGRIGEPGSVLILANGHHRAEALIKRLVREGFDPVYHYHAELPDEARRNIEQTFRTADNAVVVASASEATALVPPAESLLKLIFWHPPGSLDELTMQLFRVRRQEGGRVEGLLIYTREDYTEALERLAQAGARGREPQGFPGKLLPVSPAARELRKVRQWVLSEACRYQILVDHYRGYDPEFQHPCGRCDRCLARPFGGFFGSFLKHWLY